ncbi:MAG TPA: thioredoxin family protein [Pirellulaceae bacterium]|nr:thioredoxin family protein [Pirellulaceae bacterium]
MIDFRDLFQRSLDYRDFLQRFASPADMNRWKNSFEQIVLTAEQQQLLARFKRRMYVLCMAGTWCGDCVRQCPIMEYFAQTSPQISLRFFDRDAEREAAGEWTICGAPRVPQVVFLSEDFEFVARFGDRTLTQYRQMEMKLTGATCASGLVIPGDPIQLSTIAEWLAEFERAQLILRTSPKLRQRHGD